MPNSAPDLTAATWRKSSYSDGTNPNSCIEVAGDFPGVVPVRDSKDPQGPALVVPAASWSAFVADVKAARFPF
jgi:hypothetical protein